MFFWGPKAHRTQPLGTTGTSPAFENSGSHRCAPCMGRVPNWYGKCRELNRRSMCFSFVSPRNQGSWMTLPLYVTALGISFHLYRMELWDEHRDDHVSILSPFHLDLLQIRSSNRTGYSWSMLSQLVLEGTHRDQESIRIHIHKDLDCGFQVCGDKPGKGLKKESASKS